MSESAVFWIYTTMGLFFWSLVTTILAAFMYIFMKKEGRYFLGKSLNGAGVDHLRHEPLSNKLHLETVQWTGEWYRSKKGLYYPLRALTNPDTMAKKLYNEAIRSASRWAGNNRPVIMTTDLMSWMAGPAFYAAVAKAKESDEYKGLEPLLEKIEKLFKENKVEYFSFVEHFTASELNEIMKDVSATKVLRSFLEGSEAERLKNVKEPGKLSLPGLSLWVILAFLVIIAGGAVYWLLNSGMIKL